MKLDIEFLAEQLGKLLGANGFSWGGDACRNATTLSSILWELRGHGFVGTIPAMPAISKSTLAW
ncbi:hypothetical protein [Sinorhizobium medicae]